MPAELTPLPCPFDRCYEWITALGVTRRFRPELHNGQGPDRSVTLFTADQMQAYALENRRAQPEPAAPAEPAPGWCKHCRQYTIAEPLEAAPSVAPEPVAYKLWHPKAVHCFCLSSELPTANRSDTGGPDEYFGGRVQALYEHPPRAPLTEGALMGIYMEFDRHADKAWTPTEYLLRFAAAVDAHGIRGQG